jgi:hypothetical protein
VYQLFYNQKPATWRQPACQAPEGCQFGTGPFLVGGAPISVGGKCIWPLVEKDLRFSSCTISWSNFTARGGGGQFILRSSILVAFGRPGSVGVPVSGLFRCRAFPRSCTWFLRTIELHFTPAGLIGLAAWLLLFLQLLEGGPAAQSVSPREEGPPEQFAAEAWKLADWSVISRPFFGARKLDALQTGPDILSFYQFPLWHPPSAPTKRISSSLFQRVASSGKQKPSPGAASSEGPLAAREGIFTRFCALRTVLTWPCHRLRYACAVDRTLSIPPNWADSFTNARLPPLAGIQPVFWASETS